jgi:bacterioferritin (cytochrome b1)
MVPSPEGRCHGRRASLSAAWIAVRMERIQEGVMKKLAEKNKAKVLDLLNERLTFERAGVELYDAILQNMQKSSSPDAARMLPSLKEHRNQEKEHEEWLEAQIRALGGDAHAKTELSELITTESAGVKKVVTGDKDLVHQMHALLTAELIDNAGWELLLELADDADDREARMEFRKRLHEEEEHLIFARRAMVAFARRNVLGQSVMMPASP